jgi:hypothetical protein
MSRTFADRATEYAQKVSENGRMVVVEKNDVYWLILTPCATGDVSRTLHPVGFKGLGVKYIRERIDAYFKDR